MLVKPMIKRWELNTMLCPNKKLIRKRKRQIKRRKMKMMMIL